MNTVQTFSTSQGKSRITPLGDSFLVKPLLVRMVGSCSSRNLEKKLTEVLSMLKSGLSIHDICDKTKVKKEVILVIKKELGI